MFAVRPFAIGITIGQVDEVRRDGSTRKPQRSFDRVSQSTFGFRLDCQPVNDHLDGVLFPVSSALVVPPVYLTVDARTEKP